MSERSLPAAIALLLLAGACSAPHEYTERRFSAPVDLAGDELQVNVVFRVGDVRVERAVDAAGYTATVRHCIKHTLPEVTLHPVAEGVQRLTVALNVLPDVFFGFGGERNSLVLELPGDHPASLDLDLGGGNTVLNLEGIAVRRLHLNAGVGETRIMFGTADAVAEEVAIEALFGDVSVTGLGETSPARTLIRCGVGRMDIDLGGPWRSGGSVSIDAAAGDVSLRLPAVPGIRLAVGAPWSEEVKLTGFALREDGWYSEGYDVATLRLDVTIEAGTGDLIIEQEDEEP